MGRSQSLRRIAELQEVEYLGAERDLPSYLKAAWHVLEPAQELHWNWHNDYVCEHLMAAKAGQITRLILNIAPREMKSLMTSVAFPTWVWTAEPSTRWLFGSYADSLATAHSMLRRAVITSSWYQDRWKDRFRLSDDLSTKSEFANDKTGVMKAAGIKGAITGMGGDYIVIDDPHNPKGAESQADRESAIQNFDLAWSTRLNNKKTGRIIIIMQRLHEADLTGHLLEKRLGYTHVKVPSIAEGREVLVFPISKRELIREDGDLMHPARTGHAELEQAKQDLGPYGFSGQHQQNPTPKTGGLFQQSMFRLEETEDLKFDWTFVIADTAYKEKQENDFQCLTAFGMRGLQLYLRDVWMEQLQAVHVEGKVRWFCAPYQKQYGFRGCWIEPKGHGIYLNQALPKRGANGEPSVMIPSENDIKDFFADRHLDKVARANNAVPHLANKVIIVNKNIKNVDRLIAQVIAFPKAKFDDFTDTVIDGIKKAYAPGGSILNVL